MEKCPFCKEDDFDLEGLKVHLVHGDCEEYEKIDIFKLRPRLFKK